MSDLFAQPEFRAGDEEGASGDEDPDEVMEDDGYAADDEGVGDEGDDEEGDDEEDDDGDEGAEGDEESSSMGNRISGGRAKAVLEHVSGSLVDEPEAVTVDVATARNGVKLSLHVAPGDMGRVIGRRGRTAQAIRTIVRAAAASEGTDAVVDIVD